MGTQLMPRNIWSSADFSRRCTRPKPNSSRNLAIADAFEARQADNERRQRVGLPLRTRRRRRTTLSDLVGASP